MVLELKNIEKHYIIEGRKIEVLKGIDLLLNQGDKISLTGKSGAGKSTLLNVIATLEKPDNGEILINGENPLSMKDRKLSSFRNREIGIVYQFHHLLPEFSALENVAMPYMIRNKQHEAFSMATEMLIKVGLKDRMNHKPAELSGGEQQRIAIARALITSPNILLLDEPTGNLDEETAEMILDLIFDLTNEKNLTTIFVTHNKVFAEKMHKTVYLKEGKICEKQ